MTVLIATYFLAFLMVSTVKYYRFKDIELFRRKPFRWLVIAILLIIVMAYEPEFTLFGLFFPVRDLRPDSHSGPSAGGVRRSRPCRKRRSEESENRRDGRRLSTPSFRA